MDCVRNQESPCLCVSVVNHLAERLGRITDSRMMRKCRKGNSVGDFEKAFDRGCRCVHNSRGNWGNSTDSRISRSILFSTRKRGQWVREATSVTISPNGKTILLQRGNSTIQVWDVETGRKRDIQQDFGKYAVVEALPTCLVISQSQHAHDEIAELLRKLETNLKK